jgi:hypothetical protein
MSYFVAFEQVATPADSCKVFRVILSTALTTWPDVVYLISLWRAAQVTGVLVPLEYLDPQLAPLSGSKPRH